MILNLSQYINLFDLAVALATLAKLVIILKLGLRNISKKDNKSRIFKRLQCFDSYNFLSFKIIDKANFKFDLKIKEILHVNWRKLNLNAEKTIWFSHFHYSLGPPFVSFHLCFLPYFHCLQHQLPASFNVLIHFAITSSHNNTLCIAPFPFIIISNTNYQHLLITLRLRYYFILL